ncbi:MAG TPA: hypothetical protein VFN78_13735 [Ktedonobacterales bacterium]|nr:hypothetical protein [Ktedonobacterales bacterium]
MFDQPGRRSSTDADGLEDDDDNLSVSALDPQTLSARITSGSVARRLRGAWRASGALAALALATVVIVAVAPHLPHPSQTVSQVPYTALDAPGDLASCLVGASWSPDGQRIAVVSSASCSAPYTASGRHEPNALIFDAATGHQVETFQMDSAVRSALSRQGIVSFDSGSYDIDYYDSNWSPDGHLLEVGFAVYGASVGNAGVAFVTLSGAQRGQVRVALNPSGANAAPANGFALIPVERWDVVTGSQTTIYLPPALAYRWLPSDVLVAAEPLPDTASAPLPTTSSTTDAAPGDERAFSMWRSGFIHPVTATACSGNGVTFQPLSQPYALLTLSATVWSPDDRYLLSAFVETRLPTIAGHPAAATNAYSPCDSGLPPDQLPLAPAHDKGLSAALALLDPVGGNQLTLAWSPDGRRLAVTDFALAQGVGSALVYDCTTGAILHRFTGEQFGAARAQYGATQDPVWSPDGSRMLLTVSGAVAKLVILGPAALGQ